METNGWAVAVFAAREDLATLSRCVVSILSSAKGRTVTVDILVNGNRALAEEAVETSFAQLPTGTATVRTWFIELGDKAHTWNRYVHEIWPGGNLTFFVDGYAEVRQDAFSRMEAGVQASPEALGVTGVPTSGRTAEAVRQVLLQQGGIHGNLYAIKVSAMTAIRGAGFKLPVGLYRTDSLVGAALIYCLDPSSHGWNPQRILVEPYSTWQVRQSSWWLPSHVSGHLKRRLRQAQGVLENRAVRDHLTIKKKLPQHLPETIEELVLNWLAGNRKEASTLFLRNPLLILAVRKLKERRDWSRCSAPPLLLHARNVS